MCFKVFLCENHLEKLFYQQKEQDADPSSEGLRFRFSSPSHALSPFFIFPLPMSIRRWAVQVMVMLPRPRMAQSNTVNTTPALLGENVLFCFFTLFSLIRHKFSIFNFGYGQPGCSCACVAGERRVPAGTHFVSWLNCYQNSPGHRAPQIIFPLN